MVGTKAQKSETLLPCPFCGGPAEFEPWHGGASTKVLISCAGTGHGSEDGGCDVAPAVTGETFDEARYHWNRRK